MNISNKIPYPILDTKGHISLLYNRTDNITIQLDRHETVLNDLSNKIKLLLANISNNTIQPNPVHSKKIINNELQVDFSEFGKVLENMIDTYKDKYNINSNEFSEKLNLSNEQYTTESFSLNKSEFAALSELLRVISDIDKYTEMCNFNKVRDILNNNKLSDDYKLLCEFVYSKKNKGE